MISKTLRKKNNIMLTCMVHNYNNADYMKQCLESILLQETKYKFEVIVIDDCSTDNSKQVVEYIKNKYSATNLHFFSTKKNTGFGKKAAKALSNQIKHFLKSKYIYRIDSDDYLIDKAKFEKQISHLERNPDCVGICHHYKILNEKDNSMEIANQAVVGTFSTEQLIEMYINNVVHSYNHTSTYLFRNVFQAASPPQFFIPWIFGDHLYNFCMIKHGKICYTNDIMSVYRVHKEGAWTRLSEKRKKFLSNMLPFKIFFVISFKHKIYFLVLKLKKYLKGKKWLSY